MSGFELDSTKLWAAVYQDMQRRKISARTLAHYLDINSSALSRLKAGRPVSAHALVTIIIWLNTDLRWYAKAAPITKG